MTNFGASRGIKHEGSLLKLGYNLEEGESKRDDGLRKAVHDYGYQKTQEKLTALQVLNKSHAQNHSKVLRDQEWLREHTWDRTPSKDTAGGPAFTNKKGDRVVHDSIPSGDIRDFG